MGRQRIMRCAFEEESTMNKLIATAAAGIILSASGVFLGAVPVAYPAWLCSAIPVMCR